MSAPAIINRSQLDVAASAATGVFDVASGTGARAGAALGDAGVALGSGSAMAGGAITAGGACSAGAEDRGDGVARGVGVAATVGMMAGTGITDGAVAGDALGVGLGVAVGVGTGGWANVKLSRPGKDCATAGVASASNGTNNQRRVI